MYILANSIKISPMLYANSFKYVINWKKKSNCTLQGQSGGDPVLTKKAENLPPYSATRGHDLCGRYIGNDVTPTKS